MAAERLGDDARPVVVAGRPAEDRRHEAGLHAHGNAEVPRALGLPHGVGGGDEAVEAVLELGPLLEERARDRRLARARLLEQRRAERGGLGQREVVEEPARHRLGEEQLVVVAEARDEPALGLQPAVAHGAELLEHLDHAQELLPVGVTERVEGGAALGQALLQPLEVARRVLAARGRAPRAAVTLDGGYRRLRPLLALARDEVRHRQARELLREVAQPAGLAAPQVARHVQWRRGPEDLLEEPTLQADHRAVRQERVEQRAMAADRVHAQNHREARRALAPHEREPPRLGLRRGALAAATALARRLPARLHLLARPPVAADASEIAARRLVHLRALERVFQRSNFRFHLSNLL